MCSAPGDWDVTWVGADERRHQTMKIAGSDLVVVPDALHFLDDKEDELTRVIVTFLDRVFHSGRPAAGPNLAYSSLLSRRWEVAVAKMIHAMIRVLDLDRSTRFYRDAFGLETSSRLDFPEFSLVYLRNPENDFELELTLNRGRTEPYTHGTGYGHVAGCVDYLAGEHARVKSLGLAPNDIKEFRDGDRLIARFFFMQDPDGYKIEVLQRHGHYA